MLGDQSVVFLRGRKVSLRPLERGDLQNCVRWVNDPEIRDLIKNNWPVTLREEEQWFEGFSKKNRNDMILAMVTNDGRHIGNMGLHRIDWRGRVATTGTLIGEKDFWGKGFGTEAKILLLNHAFRSMNLRKICSQAIAYNERSIAYSRKCGYEVEGILKEHVFRRGQYWDIVNLAVFLEDFIPVWETYSAQDG